jgi:small subunit ribosomal protein S4
VKESDRSRNLIRSRLEELGEPHVQEWLKLDLPKMEGEIVSLPTPEDVLIPVEVQLIVEFCSR